MFDGLSGKLQDIFASLKGKGVLSEEDITAAMRDIRIALLEADVALPVARQFIKDIKEKALGEAVTKSVQPGQQVVKIVHDAVADLLGGDYAPMNLKGKPAIILLCGLQGAGKTTTAGKLAKYFQKQDKSVMTASLDVYRPAAKKQLQVLSDQAGVAYHTLPDTGDVVKQAKDAVKSASDVDILILDTAGRTHIDEALMAELVNVEKAVNPQETLLVADAMMGQEAANTATAFSEAVNVTGLILTRIDSDARGGAALSMKMIAKKPIRFVGVSEKLDGLQAFDAQQMADRILGMGDIVSLVEKAAEAVDDAEAEILAKKLKKGRFDFDDLLKQFKTMRKMGGVASLMGMLPGMPAGLSTADTEKSLKKQEAIILSMTPSERRDPKLLKGSRKRRVAAGAGVQVADLNKLIKQHQDMQKVVKQLGQMKGGGKLPFKLPF